MERRRGPETKRLVTVVILFCVLALPLFAVGGCGKQLARIEDNQTKIEAMVAANARDLAMISDQVYAGQGKINENIQNLDGDTRQVAAEVGTVQQQQQQLRETVAAGNDGLNRRIGSVEENQRTLQTGVTQISDVTQRTAKDLTSLTQQHTSLYQVVQANARRTADQLVGLAANDRQLSADVAKVQTSLQTTAANLASANSSLKEQVSTSHDSLTAQVAGLSAAQQRLQTGVDTLGGKAEQTATELADTRSSLQETLKVSREVLTGQMAASLQNQQTLRSDVQDLSDKADKLTANVAEVSTAQRATHETVRADHDVVMTAMAGLSNRHDTLRAGLDKLDGKADRLAGDLAAVTTQQMSLYDAMKANHDALVTRLAQVSENQTGLQTSVGSLDGKADEIAAAQSNFRQTFQGHSETVNAGLTGLANGQQGLRAQMDALTATAGQTARDVAALDNGQTAVHQAVQTAEKNLSEKAERTTAGFNSVAERQAALQQSINAGHTALAAQATALAESQQVLRSGIDNLGQATQRVASDITTMAAGQHALQQTLKAHSDKVNEQVVQLAKAQEEVKANLDTLTGATAQSSLDILALGNGQAGLAQAMKAGMSDLGVRTDKVAAGLTAVATGQNSLNDTVNRQGQAASGQLARMGDAQQQMQGSLNTLTAMAGQTSLDILALGNSQTGLTQAVHAGMTELGARTDKIADSQQQIHSSLNTLTATAGQTALDVIAMTARQEAIRTALQSHDEASGAQMAKLADHQQQMQSGLDTVTAVTGQASLDALAMNNGQGQLGQAVQAGRQEMAAKLTVMAQDQQNWSNRLEAAHAKITTISDSIATLEQQITKLQGVLQAGLQGTAVVLGATSQQRQQFETKVGQDIQAVIESLTQLRQTQASLQEQITQVQKSTQGQADSLRSVIDQMKPAPSVVEPVRESGPAPAQIKVSAAAEKPQPPAVIESRPGATE